MEGRRMREWKVRDEIEHNGLVEDGKTNMVDV